MPSEITMPQLSDTMTEGTLVKWHKKEGDPVRAGEEIADIETDKATMPMESFEDGVLAAILVKEGQKVKVGDSIAVVALAGEKSDEIKKRFAAGGTGGGAAEPKTPVPSAPDAAGAPDAAPAGEGLSPMEAGRIQARQDLTRTTENETSEQLAQRAGQAASANRGAARRGPAAGADRRPDMLPPETADGPDPAQRPRVSPLARRMAESLGVNLSQVRGSGPGGRIVQRDIEAATTETATPPAAPAPAPVSGSAPRPVGSGQTEQIELSKMRQTIAARLQQSKQQLPHFYETIDIDVEDLARVREKLNRQLEPEKIRLSISDLVNKAIAAALTRHPAVNAHFDAPNNRIIRYGDVHLGIAVALPDGLIVPVLRNIDRMGLRDIRQRTVDLVDRARGQRLKRDELSGATFTVSTLGAFGIREFSAIINPPEVGILAVGAAEKRAVVRGDQIVPRTMMTVTLSVDHRAVDGATAADFLRTLKTLMEEPGMMLA